MTLAPAADHVLAVLGLLARHAEPVPAGQIAVQLGLPRSTVYRLLGALRDQGFVSHLAEEHRYCLGLAAYELGSAYQRQEPLQRLARPLVQRLVDTTTQNAHLAVLRGRDVFYVLEDRAPHQPLLITDVGVRLPAVITASGRAILAGLPSRQIRALFPDATALEPASDGCHERLGATPDARRRPRPRLRRRGRQRHPRTVVGRRRGPGPERPPRGRRCRHVRLGGHRRR